MTKNKNSADLDKALLAEKAAEAAPKAPAKSKRGRPGKESAPTQKNSTKKDTSKLYEKIDPEAFAMELAEELSDKKSGGKAKSKAVSARKNSKTQPKNGKAGKNTKAAKSAKNTASKKKSDGDKSLSNNQITDSAILSAQSALDDIKKEKAPAAKKRGRKSNKPTLRIIPLGGLNEIGKNITVYECGDDLFAVDCGLAFPDDDMLGVDIVIPDFAYLEQNRDKFKGIVLTHGHEDHIGGLPYLLKNINVPVYGTKLTLGLVEGKLKEAGLAGKCELNVVRAGDVVKFGCMSVEFINVNHSIPDACAMAIHTPAGVVIQTGDFKIDYTPIEGKVINLARFGELGRKGVLALLSDSTNAERPGSTPSEKNVGESFTHLFSGASDRRIIIASFSSNIHRIQQIVDTARHFGRKIAVSGRSMVNVVNVAMELGYLKIPKGMLIDVEDIGRFPDSEIVIITTGSQGETMSALARMASGEHRKITVTPNDFIIISATPIPGNEKLVNRVVNDLMKLGADVIYEKMYEVHVSGHACQDELKMMLSLTNPKFFVPVHGEYKHLKKHAGLAVKMGISPANIHIASIGDVIETNGDTMKISEAVPAGKIFVDGLGVGDVGNTVIRDRQKLAQDGLIIAVMTINSVTGQILAGPDIVSRGFVYVRESEPMLAEAKRIAKEAAENYMRPGMVEWSSLKNKVKDALDRYLYAKTGRSPMILPIIEDIRNIGE